MTTADTFERALDENPANWDLRLVYADFLEEQGECVRAIGQRLQAENHRFFWSTSDSGGSWWRENWTKCGNVCENIESHIPEEIFVFIKHEYFFQLNWRAFTTRPDAEYALAVAIVKFEESKRKVA